MITAIVQARLGSTRLPGKVLKAIMGNPILLLLVERLRASSYIENIVIATSDNPRDDGIEKFCKENGIDCFRGSENDVLERHYKAAKKFGADVIVRITSDCPLVDISLVDGMIDAYMKNKEKYDIITNINPPTFPDGLDAYVFPMATLEKANKGAKSDYEREHVTPYIFGHPKIFKIMNVENSMGDLSRTHRWTLDYEEDYLFIKAVYENLYGKKRIFNMMDILKLLEEKPEIAKLNESLLEKNSFK